MFNSVEISFFRWFWFEAGVTIDIFQVWISFFNESVVFRFHQIDRGTSIICRNFNRCRIRFSFAESLLRFFSQPFNKRVIQTTSTTVHLLHQELNKKRTKRKLTRNGPEFVVIFDEDDFQIDMTEKSYSLESLWIPNGKNPSALIQMIPFNFWIACSSHTQGSSFFGTNWTYVMTWTLLISCCLYLDIFNPTLNNKCVRINFSFLSSFQTVVASLLKWCTIEQ